MTLCSAAPAEAPDDSFLLLPPKSPYHPRPVPTQRLVVRYDAFHVTTEGYPVPRPDYMKGPIRFLWLMLSSSYLIASQFVPEVRFVDCEGLYPGICLHHRLFTSWSMEALCSLHGKGTIQLHDTVRYLLCVDPLSLHSKIEFHVPLQRSPRVQYFET